MSNVSKLLLSDHYIDVTDIEDRTMFQTAMILDAFETLVKAAHDNSREKGFWDEDEIGVHDGSSLELEGRMTVKRRPINHGEKMMLIVSELSELFEAIRKRREDQPCDKDCTIIDPRATDLCEMKCRPCDGTGLTYPHHPPAAPCVVCAGTKTVKYTGVRRLTNTEEELADVIIRVMDYAGYKGIDLGRCILAKMAYNRGRPHMHGSTC